MIDRQFIGHSFAPVTLPVERGRLKFFAQSIGERNPVYSDPVAAREAGLRDILAPPTFPFVLDMEAGTIPELLEILQLDIAKLLHGTQEFEYHAPILAGDEITINMKITDIYDRKSGALEFVVTQREYRNQNDLLVARSTNNLVVRQLPET